MKNKHCCSSYLISNLCCIRGIDFSYKVNNFNGLVNILYTYCLKMNKNNHSHNCCNSINLCIQHINLDILYIFLWSKVFQENSLTHMKNNQLRHNLSSLKNKVCIYSHLSPKKYQGNN